MTAPLRAALIGLGSMGRHHARLLRDLDGVELVALVDARGDRYGVAGDIAVFAEVDPALALDLDIAVVAVPTFAHEDVAHRLAVAGVHALVEKPLAMSIDACHRLESEFRRADLVAAVGHVERFNPAIRGMKRLIDSGSIGAVRQISTRRRGPFPQRISDVGVGMDLASHDIDLSAWLTASRYQRVTAQTWTASGQQHEGILDLQAVMDDGTLVTNAVTWHSPLRERVVVALGDEGVLLADTADSSLTRYEGTSGEGVAVEVVRAEPLRAELEAFRDSVLGRSNELATFSDGLACVTVVQAALESASSGRTIHLDPNVES